MGIEVLHPIAINDGQTAPWTGSGEAICEFPAAERASYDRFCRAWHGLPDNAGPITIPPRGSYVSKMLPPCESIACYVKGAAVTLRIRCGLINARLGELQGYCRFPLPDGDIYLIAENPSDEPATLVVTAFAPRS